VPAATLTRRAALHGSAGAVAGMSAGIAAPHGAFRHDHRTPGARPALASTRNASTYRHRTLRACSVRCISLGRLACPIGQRARLLRPMPGAADAPGSPTCRTVSASARKRMRAQSSSGRPRVAWSEGPRSPPPRAQLPATRQTLRGPPAPARRTGTRHGRWIGSNRRRPSAVATSVATPRLSAASVSSAKPADTDDLARFGRI
jgi:hypothetical protein